MSSFGPYITTVLVIFAIDVIAAWALNLQYGFGGIPSFGFIMFQAAGAYAASVFSLGPSSGSGGFQHYIVGLSLPFPVPLIVAAGAGAGVAAIIGAVAVRRMRVDYQASVQLILSIVAVQLVSGYVPLFNGALGLAGIPKPLFGTLGFSLIGYQWTYVLWMAGICVGVFVSVERLTRSGWGRGLRAQRDHEIAASALGLNATRLRLQAFVIGGAFAGLSGGLLVEFIGAWGPGSWSYAETFAIFVSLLIGGTANNRGVIVGTFLVQIVFTELPSLLPQIGFPGLINALEWIIIGLLWLAAIAFRPKGLLPERRLRAEELASVPDGQANTESSSGKRNWTAISASSGFPRK